MDLTTLVSNHTRIVGIANHRLSFVLCHELDNSQRYDHRQTKRDLANLLTAKQQVDGQGFPRNEHGS